MTSWAVLGGMMLAAGGLFISLLVLGLSQASSRSDREWKLERIERKLDLILTHLRIAHDEHVPEMVIGLVRAGRTLEAIDEYCKVTGATAAVAQREIDFLRSQIAGKPSTGLTME